MKTIIGILCCVLIAWSCPAWGEEVAAGSVKTASGDCSILRSGQSLKASAGVKIYLADTLVTGSESSLGVVFKDNTVMSMGPDTRLTIDNFVFDPAEKKLGFTTRIIRGTLTCYTGLIAKLSPSSFNVHTRTAVIGVRGTRFAVKADDQE